MDDIDAGSNSRQEGKKLLRNLDNVLSSQGLRLNTSKSKILSAQDAVAHFWIQENRALTIIENSIKYGSGSFFDNLGDKTINDDFELTVSLQF